MTTVLGVIPARAGSRGIPGKNIASVAGRPLIAWTCDAARASRRLTSIVVTTDDDGVAAAARAAGVTDIAMRPPQLATDQAMIRDVLIELLDARAAAGTPAPDAVVLLQPTSPLREARHIDAAIDLLERTGADTVVSVVAVPHQFTPGSLMRLVDGRLSPLADGEVVTRRQDKPEAYARNGPAVLAIRLQALRRGSFYDGDVRALVMDRESSIDIDEPWDLELASFALARRRRTDS